ncbi:Uncharacterised protein [Mycobacteroides abscessus subsp. abscessus]|nr:Uncharacterised protein [Mycobacteroides abscessus subsp. abscessus]
MLGVIEPIRLVLRMRPDTQGMTQAQADESGDRDRVDKHRDDPDKLQPELVQPTAV